MHKRRRIGLIAISLAGCFALTLSAWSAESAPQRKGAGSDEARTEQLYKQLELFTDAVAIVEAEYIETPDPQTLMYGALKGMLAALDPYSQFMDPDAYKELKVETEGQFGGLGIEITIKDNYLTIISPIDGTPAYKAGLKSGDRIVKIDGKTTQDITILEAVKKLRGKPGTDVTVTIFRESENKVKDVKITRDVIKIESIREAKMVDAEAHIGYIRLSEFQEKSPKDLNAALQKLQAEGLAGLVLDLRDNPGGLLEVAVSVAEQFLPEKSVVVTTAGRAKNQSIEFRARTVQTPITVPLVILVNEGSASASEIVAGAIKDHHRGVLVGMKTFGKGSVQTVIPMRDGSALRLTTSKYYTPSGRCIHGEGIIPDVVVPPMELVEPDAKDQAAATVFKELEKDGESESAQPPAEGKTLEIKSGKDEKKPYDNQLAHAVDVLKGLTVYQRLE